MPGEGAGIRFGQYVLLRRIARGGMAEVFLAQQQGLEGFDRRVAVKRILPHLADVPDFIRMFLGEAKLAAQLTHPNIVHIYDFGKVESDYFIAMEYVDGVHAGDIFTHGAEGDDRLSPTMVARLGADAAAALHYAHELRTPSGKRVSLVHRDVSPANLMVSFDGVVKLCDFGIAKAAAISDQLTHPGTVKGKYAYMSPEQTTGTPLDGRSDVYALAIVLWELLSGKTIVPRGDAVEAMRAIRDGKLTPIERAAPSTPAPLAEAINWALQTKREQRPTAMQLAQALEAFIKSSPELATPMQLGAWLRERFTREPTAESDTLPEGTEPSVRTLATPPSSLSAVLPRVDPRIAVSLRSPDTTGETVALPPVNRAVQALAAGRPQFRPATAASAGTERPEHGPLAADARAELGHPAPSAAEGRPQLGHPAPSATDARPELGHPAHPAGQGRPEFDRPAHPAGPARPEFDRAPHPAGQGRPEFDHPAHPAGPARPELSHPAHSAAEAATMIGPPIHILADHAPHAPHAASSANAVTVLGGEPPPPHATPSALHAAQAATVIGLPGRMMHPPGSLPPTVILDPSHPVQGSPMYGAPALVGAPAAPTVWMQPPRTRRALAFGGLAGIAVLSFLIALAARGSAPPAVRDAGVVAVAALDAAVAPPPIDATPMTALPIDATPIDAAPVDPVPLDADEPAIPADADALATLEVRTRPDGATLKIAGQAHASPAELSLAPGRYYIDAELDGWMPERRAVELTAGARVVQEIVFTLPLSHGTGAQTGRLVARTTPPSEVFLGTRRMTETPFDIELDPGTYTLVFKHPRHANLIKRVTITAGKTTRLQLSLP